MHANSGLPLSVRYGTHNRYRTWCKFSNASKVNTVGPWSLPGLVLEHRRPSQGLEPGVQWEPCHGGAAVPAREQPALAADA